MPRVTARNNGFRVVFIFAETVFHMILQAAAE